MSIPYLKQKLNPDTTTNSELKRIPEHPTGRAPAAAPTRPLQARPGIRGAPLAAVGLLIIGLLIVVPTPVAAVELGFEDFEDYEPGTTPNGDFYLTAYEATSYITDEQAHTGEQSFRTDKRGGYIFTEGTTFCDTGQSVNFWIRLEDIVPSAGTEVHIGITGGGQAISGTGAASQFAGLKFQQAGVVSASIIGAGGGVTTAFAGTYAADTWYHVIIDELKCEMPNYASTGKRTQVFVSFNGEGKEVFTNFGFSQAENLFTNLNTGTSGITTPGTVINYLDDLSLNSAGPAFNQVAVTGLVGYSMDGNGGVIVVRTDDGETIETYAVDDLSQLATASTPTCSTSDGAGSGQDGVNAASFFVDGGFKVYITYLDCDGDGESDVFRIRDPNLQPYEDRCPDAEQDIENDVDAIDNVDVPNNMGEIGVISDLPPSYLGRCDNEEASVGWSFSTAGTLAQNGGRIGAFGVTFNSGVFSDLSDEETISVDTTAVPVVSQYCAWTSQDTGKDFIGGVSANGRTVLAEVQSSVILNANLNHEPDIDVQEIWSNNGQYNNANTISCASDTFIIATTDEIVYFFENSTEVNEFGFATPDVRWSLTGIDVPTSRGTAITGSERFVAILNGDNLEIRYSSNGTLTSDPFPVPSGLWKGMEFDSSGEHLAVFTADFITVYDTADNTCALTDTCTQDGGQGDGDPTPSPTPTPGPGDDDGELAFLDNIYFWVVIWILIFEIAVALLSWLTRAGFGGHVYLVVGVAVYIAAILINGAEAVNPWPIVVLLAISIALAITWWARR